MTKSDFPSPKVRVTRRDWTPERPHDAQSGLGMIDSDEEERARWADFNDRLGGGAFESEAPDDDLRFAGVAISLALDDAPGEDNVFKVKDREIVILKLISSVDRHDIVQSTNQIADAGNGQLRHELIVPKAIPGA